MANLQAIDPKDFLVSPFKLIGQDAMLIAAEKDGRCNAMTASWGGLGVMWRRNVAFTVIRPQRFTKEFVDSADTYSLNFFPSGNEKMLNYMGSASGRDEDKIAKAGLTVERDGATPYFGGVKAVMLCRKLFAQPYRPEFFVDMTIDPELYAKKDYHTLYIGEVTKILALPGSL